MKKNIIFIFIIISNIVFSSDNSSFAGLPIIATSEETGIIYGAMANYSSTIKDKNKNVNFGFMLTQKKQNKFFGSLKFGNLKDEKIVKAEYEEWSFPYFGVGNNSKKESKTIMDKTGFNVGAKYILRLNQRSSLNILTTYENYEIGYEKTIENIYGKTGMNLLEIGAGYKFDQRDKEHRNVKKNYLDSYLKFDFENFSDYKFTQMGLDLRKFIKLSDKNILGIQGIINLNIGEVPIQKMVSLGDNYVFRGVSYNRYIDKNRLAIQTEYRYPMLENFSGVVFGSYGKVFDDFKSGEFITAWGIGLRYLIDESNNTNVRLDIGYYEDEKIAYFTIGEAF